MASNEKEIRLHLRNFIDNKYKGITLDEFTGGSMRTRPDLMHINEDKIIMCEIKSDKDSLSRLRTQVEDYLKHSSKVYVVLDVTHINAYKKLCDKDESFKLLMFSYYVEVYWFDTSLKQLKGDLLLEVNQRHGMRSYKSINVEKLYNFLWGEEQKSLISFLKGRSKLSVSNNPTIWNAIEYIYSIYELRKLIFEILNDRIEKLSTDRKFSRSYTGGKYKSDIQDMDYKQLKFNEFLSKTI